MGSQGRPVDASQGGHFNDSSSTKWAQRVPGTIEWQVKGRDLRTVCSVHTMIMFCFLYILVPVPAATLYFYLSSSILDTLLTCHFYTGSLSG